MSLRNRIETLESHVLDVIEGRRKGKRAAALRLFLLQLSFLFGFLVQLRLRLYRHGILRHEALGCQVLSVGNLTVGGTGKTPVVEVFARSLQKRGRKVAILSRGYKKTQPSAGERLVHLFTRRIHKPDPLVVSDGKRLLLNSADGGDEPYMLASNLPGVAVVVGKNRVHSGQHAIRKLGCDTLILDDGFQYLDLRHRLDIVLVDRTNPFGNGYVLPRGILREPIKNIKRAGFIFITKSNGDGAEELKQQLRSLNPTAEISECRHRSRYLQNVYTRDQESLESLKHKRVVAVSGIAAPKGFEQELERLGAEVIRHFCFADHHRYSQQEIIDMVNESLNLSADMIVTTEKDAVRFPSLQRRDVSMYFLRVQIEMLSGEEAFQDWVARIAFQHQ